LYFNIEFQAFILLLEKSTVTNKLETFTSVVFKYILICNLFLIVISSKLNNFSIYFCSDFIQIKNVRTLNLSWVATLHGKLENEMARSNLTHKLAFLDMILMFLDMILMFLKTGLVKIENVCKNKFFFWKIY
jgi:hypothetical protein